jgi:hypothetical protein
MIFLSLRLDYFMSAMMHQSDKQKRSTRLLKIAVIVAVKMKPKKWKLLMR